MSKIIKALKQAVRYARGDKSQCRSTIIQPMTDEERKCFEESPQFKRIVAKAEKEGWESK